MALSTKLAEHYRGLLATFPSDQAAWRGETLELFIEAGFPTTRDEAWRFTNLRKLAKKTWQHPDKEIFSKDLTWQNGTPPATQKTPDVECVHTQQSVLDESLPAFSQLTQALCPQPTHIYVYKDTRLTFAGNAPNDVMTHSALDITLHDGVELTIADDFDDQALHMRVLRIHVEPNARASIVHVAQPNSGFNITHTIINQHENSHISLCDLKHNSLLSRETIDVYLQGEGATFTSAAASLADTNEHLDHTITVHHDAKHTHSEQWHRAIAGDKSNVVFNSQVIMNPGAVHANSKQHSRCLLLNDSAKVHSKPTLEIHVDEVTASHGATVGQLDEASLFYLKTRGFSHAQAREALMQGFLKPIIDRCPSALGDDLLTRQLPNVLASN